nr:SpoIIE family protein phosphatase [Angustibacter aerolatus]
MSTQEHAAVTASGSLVEDAQRLYDAAPCGYLSTAPDGTVVQVNATFLALTGYSADEARGSTSIHRPAVRRGPDLLRDALRPDALHAGQRAGHRARPRPRRRQAAADAGQRRAGPRRGGGTARRAGGRLRRHGPPCLRARACCAPRSARRPARTTPGRSPAPCSRRSSRPCHRTCQGSRWPPSTGPRAPAPRSAATSTTSSRLAEDDWFVVLGDVCGKGPGAAVVTSLLRHAVRAAAVASPDVETALRLTNDVLLRDDSDRFCTALLARLRRRAGRWHVTLCAAGHPLPVLVPATGTTRLVGAPGSLLGVLAELEPARHRARAWRPATASCSTPTGSPRPGATASSTATTGCSRRRPAPRRGARAGHRRARRRPGVPGRGGARRHRPAGPHPVVRPLTAAVGAQVTAAAAVCSGRAARKRSTKRAKAATSSGSGATVSTSASRNTTSSR